MTVGSENDHALTAEALEHDLATARVGRTCVVYDRVQSTNDVLRAVASDRRYDGLAVFANHQTAGRGRNGRTWLAEPNSSLLCSVLAMFPGRAAALSGPVNLSAAVAVVRAVRKCFDIGAAIRWPNDIYIEDRKLGGVLIESSQIDQDDCAFIIGIGVNVTQNETDFPAGLAERACSIATALDRRPDPSARLTLARQVMIELDHTFLQVSAGAFDPLRTEWLSLLADRHRPVTFNHDNRRLEGRIIDVDCHDHSLLIQDHTGLIWHLQPNVSRLVK